MKRKRILIIDDERPLLESLEMFLTEKGYAVRCAVAAEEGIRQCAAFDPHVIVLDIRLPDMNGLDVLQELVRTGRRNIIIITAFHDMDTTIKAVKYGAFDYIPKPIDVEELDSAIEKALKTSPSGRSDSVVSLDSSAAYMEGVIIGKSRGMKDIFKAIGALSGNRITVLVEGETGTGKELIARAIHHNSPCKERPFRAINCSTIVGNLLESELFGHEKGAFTGASHAKKGKFELAGDGTIFLDEIGEIPFELQSKLLRFLQEKEFERLGGEKKIKSDARVIAATNRDLKQMVDKGLFREDLYYRLKVFPMHVPPLRDRREDIPLLVHAFISEFSGKMGKKIHTVPEGTMEMLKHYQWPGNVRELRNIIEQAVIVSDGDMLQVNLPKRISVSATEAGTLEKAERQHIIEALEKTGWRIKGRNGAAELLGLKPSTLYTKMEKLGIPTKREKGGITT